MKRVVLALIASLVCACSATHHCARSSEGIDASSSCNAAWRCDEGLRVLTCTDAGAGEMGCQCLEDGRAARTYDAPRAAPGLCTPLDAFEVACTGHCGCGWSLPDDNDCSCP